MNRNFKIKPSFFLREGALTKITPQISRIAKSIEGQGLERVLHTLEWMRDNLKTVDMQGDPRWFEIFHKRDAQRIISDGFATGCSDYGIVFATLCRASGIPARHLETFSREGLKNKEDKVVRGHIFVDVFVLGKWILVDPTQKTIHANFSISRGYIIYGIGLDSHDFGFDCFERVREAYTQYKKTF